MAGSVLSQTSKKTSLHTKAIKAAWLSSSSPDADLVLNIDNTLVVVAAKHLTRPKAGAVTNTISGLEVFVEGPTAKGLALLRGREQLEALLTQTGGTFTQDQVITMLYGISRQAVDKRVREGSLLAVPGPNGARRYPVCQFLADGSLIKGLKEVQAALPVRGPWSAFLFLMQPHDGLEGRKPLDLLREGDVARVVAAAEGLGVQGS